MLKRLNLAGKEEPGELLLLGNSGNKIAWKKEKRDEIFVQFGAECLKKSFATCETRVIVMKQMYLMFGIKFVTAITFYSR